MKNKILLLAIIGIIFSCNKDENTINPTPENPELLILPIVVHIIHGGENIGQGSNLSTERIKEQIRSLNDDFRRKKGTLGENNSPISDDSFIQFKLTEVTPNGNPTNGITRINYFENIPDKDVNDRPHDWLPKIAYWNPEKYINVWVYGGFPQDQLLGLATIPTTNLPGLEAPLQALGDGIMINALHFGKSDMDSGANLGKTLTHEMGHFLGLFHVWGRYEGKGCQQQDDHIQDTAPVAGPIDNCDNPPLACDGKIAPVNNYMNITYDKCLNVFTKEQIKRMRYVLENAARRKNLTSSNTIDR
ncbi:M43 family zinc metalloprotease [Tenacibaculum sp. MAR_2009_124]|uniref:M43 family zinc metalloprotease n=1 Tax=Tenacibaculum sp. MAR_2009_124 TaxID=1250059 RepID=UPI0015A31A0A|nr:M43 family zinc metalloprotease [Tenacibaculum sp. MAR_2009_124]